MSLLPDVAKNFHLSDDAVAGLRGYLQEQLDHLSSLPEDATLRQIMENHFERGAVVRERITGKRQLRQIRLSEFDHSQHFYLLFRLLQDSVLKDC